MRIFLSFIIVFIGFFGQISFAQNDTTEQLKELREQLTSDPTDKKIEIYDRSEVIPVPFPNDYKKEYLANEDYNYDQAQTRDYMSEFREWFENMLMKFFKITKRDKVSDLVDVLLNVIYGIIFVLVLYFIAKAIFRKEGRWIFSKKKKELKDEELNIVSEVKIEEMNNVVERYKGEGNYRMAIRYYFIWLLKKLAEDNIIKLEDDKTSSEYAYEIKDESKKKDFQYAAYLYNYIWFGEFDIDKTSFESAEKAFKKIIENA